MPLNIHKNGSFQYNEKTFHLVDISIDISNKEDTYILYNPPYVNPPNKYIYLNIHSDEYIPGEKLSHTTQKCEMCNNKPAKYKAYSVYWTAPPRQTEVILCNSCKTELIEDLNNIIKHKPHYLLSNNL